MKFESVRLNDAWGNSCALTNLVLRGGRKDVMKITDAIEDSKDGDELCRMLNDILFSNFHVNRETDDYIRLLSVDMLGNKDYLIIMKN